MTAAVRRGRQGPAARGIFRCDWKAGAVLLAAALAAGGAAAHDGVEHGGPAEAAAHAAPAGPAPGAGTPLPFDLGGPFRLTDQTGAERGQVDPAGRLQLLFFGYANCRSICAVALPLMGAVTDLLAADGVAVVPVMITIDPARDTVATIGPPLAAHHPDFVGLTGDAGALRAVRDAFGIARRVAFEDPAHGPVYAHGSHVFLLDPTGRVLTLLPPVLSAARMAEIVRGYAAAAR